MIQPKLAPPPLHTLVASRLCHDVIGPVGAIGNGVELIEAMGGDASIEDMALIAESARTARERLEFLRIAFGREAAGGQGLAPAHLEKLCRPMFLKPRLSFQFHCHSGSGAGQNPRLVTLALLAFEKALPRGGTLALSDAPGYFTVIAKGDVVVLSERTQALLNSANARAEEPGEVEYQLLGDAIRASGAAHGVQLSANHMELTFPV